MTASPLVSVVPGTIGNVQCLTVDGRALHGVLGVRRDFSTWMKGRISKYGFAQGHDFEIFSKSDENSEIDSPVLGNQKKRGGDRRSLEYRCSLDMGKELCMVENNEKGRMARRYFIECERRLLASEVRAALSADVKPLSTAASRAPLRGLVHAWAQVSGVAHSALWPQVRAHFQLSRIDDLPESWLPDALAFVQEKIDQCVKGLPNPAPVAELPAALEPAERPLIYRDGKYYPMRKNRKHVAGPREKAILDFWSYEYPRREEEIEERFKKLLEGIDTAIGDTIHQAVAAIGRDADTMFSISCLLEGLYSAEDRARESFKEALRLARLHMRMATSMATALNR